MEVGWGNGYVALPPGHKYHGVEYDDIPVDVHGGLTYSSIYKKNSMGDGFEWPEDWEGHWIIGFDCAHAYDNLSTCPKEFVEAEVQRLAEQL